MSYNSAATTTGCYGMYGGVERGTGPMGPTTATGFQMTTTTTTSSSMSSRNINNKRTSSKEDREGSGEQFKGEVKTFICPTNVGWVLPDHSDSSMVLDLHVEGAGPITLLVRDESRSTRSTSGGNRDTSGTSLVIGD